MIFVGDISLPFENCISYTEVPDKFHHKNWFGNLEGGILDGCPQDKPEVFNNKKAIQKLLGDINFIGFAIGNNHITDSCPLQDTIEFLNANNIQYCGAGLDFKDANRTVDFIEGNSKVKIVNFGWEVIQCDVVTKDKPGVNPLNKKNVLNTIKNLVENFPDNKIIPFMHWSYELEAEPQPFERELAKAMIDLGAAGVIGCHPHRIGGIEFHNNKPIIYSLGNWLFMQNFYHNKKLKFPAFCSSELAFEWDFDSESFKLHFFEFDSKNSTLHFDRSQEITPEVIDLLTPFSGLTNDEYKIWYKKNHFHKGKGLPIYYWDDSYLKQKMKNSINKLRDNLLKIYIKYRKS